MHDMFFHFLQAAFSMHQGQVFILRHSLVFNPLFHNKAALNFIGKLNVLVLYKPLLT